MQGYGVICYLRYENFTLYRWIHITCIARLADKKIQNKIVDDQYPWANIAREGAGCSICGINKRKKELLSFGFLIHEDCINDLIHMTNEVVKTNEKQIITGSL